MIDPTHKTYKFKNGIEHWLRYEDGWVCSYCYGRLVRNPKRSSEYNKKYNDIGKKRRIRYHNERIWVGFDLIRDTCSLCRKKNGDKMIDKNGKNSTIIIHLHHYFYIPIMVWACTYPLCSQHHQIHHKSKKIRNKTI